MKRPRNAIAIIVLIVFGFHTLGIVNFAHAAFPTATTPSAPAFVQSAQGLTQAVAEAQTLLLAIQGKAARGEDTSVEVQQLQVVGQTVQALLGQLQGELDATAQRLQALVQAGTVASEALAQFETFRANLGNAAIDALNTLFALSAPSPTPLGERAAAASAALNTLTPDQPLSVTQTQLDPTKLPHRRSDIPHRELEVRPAIIPGQAPPSPADLAPTVDVPLTPEIQALAASLNFDPVELFAFVRNSMEFQPYFGSLKGAQGTLLEKAGNDMDQASLLIALLRASNVPARYVAGVVELPISHVMKWVGVESPEAAAEAFISNGFPAEVRRGGGGTPNHLSLFHIWVEAFLPQGRGPDSDRGQPLRLGPARPEFQAARDHGGDRSHNRHRL